MIIVTGANGFIGSSIVWELNQSGHTDIVCVDTISLNERNLLLQNKTFSKFLLPHELWDFLDLPENKSKIKWVIHMGACSSTTETNWEFLYQNNTYYTQRLFEWCQAHDADFIYASSAATYGNGELGFSDETSPEKLKPLNLYGDSKVLFDRWVLKQNTFPKSWYGLKFFNVYGPNETFKGPQASVVFKAFHEIQKTNELKLFKSFNPNYEDGKQLRDFVYVKDITRWILELMSKRPQNGIYNMGFGKARTWLDLATNVFAALEKPMKINWIDVPENIRNQYQYFTQADMTKWEKNNLSEPIWSLEKAIADNIKNYHLLNKIL